MKSILQTSFLCFILSLATFTGCHEKDDEFEVTAPGTVNLFISIENWDQDSLSSLTLNIEEITLDGPQGLQSLREFDGPKSYNVLEYQGEPGIMVTEEVQAGIYSGYEVKMSMLIQGADGKDHKVKLCHIPPGKPEKQKTLYINACAVPAHTKNHGDYLGFCTNDESERNEGYSYVQYENGKIVMLFSDRKVFSGSMDVEVVEGDTTDMVMTFDLSQSITLEPKIENDDNDGKDGRRSDHDDDDDRGDDDDHGDDDDKDDGDGHHGDHDHDHDKDHDHNHDKDHDHDKDDDDDKDREDEEECLVYVFDPVMTIEVLARKGKLEGVFTGHMNPGRDYLAFIYRKGEYSSSEANRNNPFPNALASAAIDVAGHFTFIEEFEAGEYELLAAEYFRDRFWRIASKDISVVEISPNDVLKAKIE